MKRNIILIITFIWLGFIALIAQTIALRELLVVFFGNELCLGIIFTAWLLGITIGAFIVSFITDRVKSTAWILTIILFLITLALPMQIGYIRTSRALLDIPLGQHIPFFETLYMSFLLVVPFSILIGIAFPVACKIYAQNNTPPTPLNRGEDAQSIGKVYIWEALGSLLAGIIFTFYMVELFTVSAIVILCSTVTLLLAAIHLNILRRKALPSSKPIYTIFLALCIIIIAGIISPSTCISSIERNFSKSRWESIYGKDIKLVRSVNSKYGDIAIGKLQDQYSLVENGKYISSFPDDYTHAPLAHLFMTQHPAPKNVLLIGGGIEGLIKEMLKYPIESLDYVQLDPKIIQVVKWYIPDEARKLIESDKRLQIHYLDGRQFVKDTSNKYDLIIINLPDPSTATVNRFYTTDFFEEAKQCLNKGGVLATRCSSAVNYFGEDVGNYTGSVYDSLAAVFKQVLVTPGTEAHFFATDAPDTITFDIKTLDERYRASKVESKYFISPASFETILEPQHIELTRKALADRKQHYLNTDLKPITYFFNLVLWDTMTGESASAGTFFKTMAGIRFDWVLGAILIIAAIWFGIRFIGRWITAFAGMTGKSNALLSMFIIGLSGLSLELILILAFQNIYGYLYQYIGFMIALFMAGLALGAIISNRLIERWHKRYWTIHLALVILSLALTWLLGIAPHIILISILMIAIGTLTGMAYPLLSKIYLTRCYGAPGASYSELDPAELRGYNQVGKAAGLIDAFDHLGACLGALFTGVLLIPLFGITQTCLLIALLNLLTVIFIAIPLPQRYKIPE